MPPFTSWAAWDRFNLSAYLSGLIARCRILQLCDFTNLTCLSFRCPVGTMWITAPPPRVSYCVDWFPELVSPDSYLKTGSYLKLSGESCLGLSPPVLSLLTPTTRVWDPGPGFSIQSNDEILSPSPGLSGSLWRKSLKAEPSTYSSVMGGDRSPGPVAHASCQRPLGPEG